MRIARLCSGHSNRRRHPGLWAMAASIATVAALGAMAPARAQIAFDDVTATAGIDHFGPSFGASWGDVNGDSYPDIWTGNHNSWPPSLHLNLTDGRFRDIVGDVYVGREPGDRHGAAWADFDNDGDSDLFQVEGNSLGFEGAPNQFLVNSGGLLVDQAVARGLAYPFPNPFSSLGSGITPLWLDFDSDGDLDLIETSTDQNEPSVIFAQTDGLFDIASVETGLSDLPASHFAQLTGFGTEGPPTALFQNLIQYPFPAYRYDVLPFEEMSAQLGASENLVWDVAIADFNGDLTSDLFLARRDDVSDLLKVGTSRVRSHLVVDGDEKGFFIQTDGNLVVRVGATNQHRDDTIFIGAAGLPPLSTVIADSRQFFLSASDPNTVGWAAHQAGVDGGLFIGRHNELPLWAVFLSGPQRIEAQIEITGVAPIENLSPIGFVVSDGAGFDVLLARSLEGSLVDMSEEAGLNALATPCESVAAGDLDNDGDVDLYLVCNRGAANQPNLLLENLGDGSFAPVANAGGAAGSNLGLGDTVAMADYDLDGFLDLFVTNGGRSPFFNQGPDQLFHNLGNANHWLEIDLEGVVSNRDAVGTRVLVTAGGITQVREQAGGIHRSTQDHSRLHFGLGVDANIEELTVEWPTGDTQQLFDIPADQLIRIVEPSTPSLDGEPEYQPGVDGGVFLWRDPTDGIHRLRASGNGTPASYIVRLVAERQIEILDEVGIGLDDELALSPNGFSLTAVVESDEAGLDFRLPPGTSALIAVERDGRPNPRHLQVGVSGDPLSPIGWIKALGALPAPPAFGVGEDLGLFVGRPAASDIVQMRWNGDGVAHATDLTVFSSRPLVAVAPFDLEPGDTPSFTPFSLSVAGEVDVDADGIDLTVQPGTLVGISYLQDGLFQSHRVNPGTFELGLPNASFITAP